jgi:hypothetical protein
MSSLSPREAAAVFAAIIPGFRLDARGKYRGPAGYRGGDNPTALSVDVSRGGLYFDHVSGDGGDVVDFAKVARDTDLKSACRFVSDTIGRDILTGKPTRQQYSRQTLARAALFQSGAAAIAERTLELIKPLLWSDDAEIAAAAGMVVQTLTEELPIIRNWRPDEAVAAMRRAKPSLVRQCVADANEARLQLAEAINQLAESIAGVL